MRISTKEGACNISRRRSGLKITKTERGGGGVGKRWGRGGGLLKVKKGDVSFCDSKGVVQKEKISGGAFLGRKGKSGRGE